MTRFHRGFALIIVLNVVVVLATIAVSVSQSAREGGGLARNFREQAIDRALADAGMNLAAYRISHADNEEVWHRDGRPYSVDVLGRQTQISVQDEMGKYSVNGAGETMLASAFVNLGIDAGSAQRLSASIVDWRDIDDFRRLGGAESADYAANTQFPAPSNTLFQRLSELNAVQGMTEKLYKTVRPILTAYADGAAPDLGLAPKAVLEAYFGRGAPQIADFLDRRKEPGQAMVASVGAGSDTIRSNGLSRQTGETFRTAYSITISFPDADGDIARYTGVFRLAQDVSGTKIVILEPMRREN